MDVSSQQKCWEDFLSKLILHGKENKPIRI